MAPMQHKPGPALLMAAAYTLSYGVGAGVLNVDSGEGIVLSSATNLCGSYFEKEALGSATPPAVANPDDYDFFYLRVATGSKPYLGAIWAASSSSTEGADATTAFTLGAVASTSDAALICATAVADSAADPSSDAANAEAFQGLGASLLYVFLDKGDAEPKGICVPSSTPHRVYKTPVACTAGSHHCPLTWQACGASGFCEDRSVQPKAPKTYAVPNTSLWFPNCPSRNMLTLEEVPNPASTVQVCVTPPSIANSPAVIQRITNDAETKVIRYATWVVCGVLLLVGVSVVLGTYLSATAAQKRFQAHLRRLSELEAAAG